MDKKQFIEMAFVAIKELSNEMNLNLTGFVRENEIDFVILLDKKEVSEFKIPAILEYKKINQFEVKTIMRIGIEGTIHKMAFEKVRNKIFFSLKEMVNSDEKYQFVIGDSMFEGLNTLFSIEYDTHREFISKAKLKEWGISVEELTEIALTNVKNIMPFNLKSFQEEGFFYQISSDFGIGIGNVCIGIIELLKDVSDIELGIFIPRNDVLFLIDLKYALSSDEHKNQYRQLLHGANEIYTSSFNRLSPYCHRLLGDKFIIEYDNEMIKN